MQGWDSNQVVFIVGIKVEEGVADLLDMDSAGEGGFLGVVALKSDAMLIIPDRVGCDRWMMADLF